MKNLIVYLMGLVAQISSLDRKNYLAGVVVRFFALSISMASMSFLIASMVSLVSGRSGFELGSLGLNIGFTTTNLLLILAIHVLSAALLLYSDFMWQQLVKKFALSIDYKMKLKLSTDDLSDQQRKKKSIKYNSSIMQLTRLSWVLKELQNSFISGAMSGLFMFILAPAMTLVLAIVIGVYLLLLKPFFQRIASDSKIFGGMDDEDAMEVAEQTKQLPMKDRMDSLLRYLLKKCKIRFFNTLIFAVIFSLAILYLIRLQGSGGELAISYVVYVTLFLYFMRAVMAIISKVVPVARLYIKTKQVLI